MQNYIPFSFSIQSIGLPVIPVKLFDMEEHALLLIDTGSDRSILDESVFCYLEEKIVSSPKEIKIANAGSLVDAKKCGMVSFSYEDHHFTEEFLCMDCSEGFNRIRQETGYQLHGILGTDYLFKHQWVIDFENCQIIAR